jgi:uncharacterized protein YPO0396
MFKERHAAAIKVAESLFAAEDAIDEAVARVAELSSTLATARMEARLSAVVGQDAFDGAASALAALSRARRDIVETHNSLSDAKVQIGLRVMSVGELGKPPAAHQDAPHLQAVA